MSDFTLTRTSLSVISRTGEVLTTRNYKFINQFKMYLPDLTNDNALDEYIEVWYATLKLALPTDRHTRRGQIAVEDALPGMMVQIIIVPGGMATTVMYDVKT